MDPSKLVKAQVNVMLEWLAEQRVQAAIRAGEFDDLPGAHQPLPPDRLDPLIPQHLRAAMRVIRNSGGTPAEVMMRRELAHINTQIAHYPQKLQNNEVPVPLKILQERRLALLVSLRITY